MSSKFISLSLALRRSWWALLFAGLLSLGGGGCAGGEVSMVATTAGGKKVLVPLGQGGAKLTNEGGVQIEIAAFTVNAEKKIVYAFGFTDSRKRALRSVRIEDVSDDASVTLVDNAQPKESSTGLWHGDSEPIDFTDPRMNWTTTISNSVRVFRFTLTFSDGQTLVLHQGTLYPAPAKEGLRRMFGKDY